MQALEYRPAVKSLEQTNNTKAIEVALWALGALSICFSLWAVSVGWYHSIFDFHGFRQAQTAISANSILYGGPILHYETPVLGPPWSIPFEFPLYQVLVALLAKLLSSPLDQTGRFVSVFAGHARGRLRYL